jgi:hypothetical protein
MMFSASFFFMCKLPRPKDDDVRIEKKRRRLEKVDHGVGEVAVEHRRKEEEFGDESRRVAGSKANVTSSVTGFVVKLF